MWVWVKKLGSFKIWVGLELEHSRLSSVWHDPF